MRPPFSLSLPAPAPRPHPSLSISISTDAPRSLLAVVTLGGAVLFIIFGFVYAHEGYNWQPPLDEAIPFYELLEKGTATGADLVKGALEPV